MKDDLRKAMREKIHTYLANRTPGQKDEPISFIPPDTKTLFTFLSTKHEISTKRLISQALTGRMLVAAPRVEGQSLKFYRIHSAEGPFTTGKFGICEPTGKKPPVFPSPIAIQLPLLVLVPGLAFAKNGNRLGKGGGYYDRFLADLLAAYGEKTVPVMRKNITLAGVAWSFQIVDALPAENFDIPVDCVFTEKGCILCNERDTITHPKEEYSGRN